MKKDEIEALEKEILRLLEKLNTAKTQAGEERDAALARIACAACDALPEETTPGQRVVAAARFSWPVLCSLNSSMNPSRTTLDRRLRALKLGSAYGLSVRRSAWKLTPQVTVVLRYLQEFTATKLRLSGRPKNWFSDPEDDDRCLIEHESRSLPKFSPSTIAPWLDLIETILFLESNGESRAKFLNGLFITDEGMKRRVSKRASKSSPRMSGAGIDSETIQVEVRHRIRKILFSLSGARRK